MYSNLTLEDITAFENRWPDAAAFLRGRRVYNEYAYLRHMEDLGHLNDWQRKRLGEFRTIFGEKSTTPP